MPSQTDKPPARPVVTRFAPSPTGNLHIGGARTALFAWAFARQNQGQLILRIEDTDLARSNPMATYEILRNLDWLDLNWDQGPILAPDPDADHHARDRQKGDHGPYCQSQRCEDGIYDKQIQRLLVSGQAYEDGDAVRFRMDKTIAFEDVVYGPIEVKAADLEDFIIRKGEKGGRLPTFHFAVTVDDAMMGVTHVIRGQEHLANTPKHAALCDALGFARPQWVHLPSIMNADGTKMSKRDKAKMARAAAKDYLQSKTEEEREAWITHLIKLETSPTHALSPGHQRNRQRYQTVAHVFTVSEYNNFINGKNDEVAIAHHIAADLGIDLPESDVQDFRMSGYLPAVLLNYIALLGWNPGDDTERFDLDFLIEHFSPERIGKKNSQFDRAKLAKFNAEALAEMRADKFHDLLRKHFEDYHSTVLDELDKLSDTGFRTFASMYQSRSQTLNTPAELGRFFVCGDDDIEYTPKAVKKNLTKNDGEGLKVLQRFRGELDTCDDWTADALHSLIESFVEKHQLKNMGSVAQPLRVALTGSAVSPEIGPTLELLGKDAVLNRIYRCVEAVSG